MMSTTQRVLATSIKLTVAVPRQNKKSVDIAGGIVVGLASSVVPFAVSLGLAQINGLNGFNYPAVGPMAAAAGLAVCLLAMPIAYELSRRSVQTIVATTSIIFWILGLMVAFTIN